MIPTTIRMTPKIAAGFTIALTLERTPPGDQIYDQDDDRDDEQQVNERATEMTDESEEPENQQHNKNSPEHMFSFELVYFASHPGSRVRLRFSEILYSFSRGGSLWHFEESTGGSDLEGLQRHCRLNLPIYALQTFRCFTPRSPFGRRRFWRSRRGETLTASTLRRGFRLPWCSFLYLSGTDRHFSQTHPRAAPRILDSAGGRP